MTQAANAVNRPDARTPQKWVSFTVLFLIEMWERFGYYGMTAVVVLYMVKKLGYSDDKANLTFGAFVAMAYASPAVGGWLGDKVLGTRRVAIIGATILAIGYALLATPGFPLFVALGVVAVGAGCSSPTRRTWSRRCTRATRRRSTRPSPSITWRSTSARRSRRPRRR